MTSAPDRRKYQSLYPEPKARTGMEARKPTEFKVPVIKLALLLFFPPFMVTTLSSTYLLGAWSDVVLHSLYFTVFVTGLILLILLSAGLLGRARAIIERNCSHPFFLQSLYFVLVVLTGWTLVSWLSQWSMGMELIHIIIGEAIVFFVVVFAVVLIAKQFSR